MTHIRHFIIKKDYANHLLDLLINDGALEPITNDEDFELSNEMKTILEERLMEDEATYITAEESINQLNLLHSK